MANSKFKLDKVSGTGKGSIKIAPVESTSQNSYTETYQVKVYDKVISKVELKLLKVPKDKYVPTSDDGLEYISPQFGSDYDHDIHSLETLLDFFKRRNISNTVPYNKPVNILHHIPSDDPDYLNKVGNLIYLWEYRTNKWVSLSSVRKKLNIGASEDFVLNTAYYGGIMLHFLNEYKLPDTLLKDDATKGYVEVFGTNYIFWPNRYTQGGNSSNKPYHVKIKLKDSTPIGGYRGGYNDCTYTQLKRNIQQQYERNDTPRIFYTFLNGEDRKIDTLYTYYSSSHINISLQEDQPSPFNFIVLYNYNYIADRIKVGTEIISLHSEKMLSGEGNFTKAMVLKGLDEYTIPRVPTELGFIDLYYGKRPHFEPDEDEDEGPNHWED